jgi:hypothetical protein
MCFLQSPLPGRPPSRCRGRAEAQPSPPLAPRPPGLGTQGKPVCPFASHRNGGGFVHRRECGALHCSHSRPTRAVSPSPSPWFSPAPRAVTAALRHRVLPMANARPSSPPPELRTMRGEAPPLERGTRCLPAVTPVPSRFFHLSPYEVPKLGVLRHGTAGQDPRRGNSEQRGDRTLPVTRRAIARPQVIRSIREPVGAPSRFPW